MKKWSQNTSEQYDTHGSEAMQNKSYQHHCLVILVQFRSRNFIFGKSVAMVSTCGHFPGEFQGLPHCQHGRVLLLLIGVSGQFPNQVLATIDGVAVVEDLTIKMGGTNGQLTRQSFQKSRFSCDNRTRCQNSDDFAREDREIIKSYHNRAAP